MLLGIIFAVVLLTFQYPLLKALTHENCFILDTTTTKKVNKMITSNSTLKLERDTTLEKVSTLVIKSIEDIFRMKKSYAIAYFSCAFAFSLVHLHLRIVHLHTQK